MGRGLAERATSGTLTTKLSEGRMPSEPRYYTLPALFDRRVFRVPDYQRGYAWTTPQLEDLWNDLMLLDDKGQHFTGMIVAEGQGDPIYDPMTAETSEVMAVIDGQQRITSMVLLMLAIIEELERAGQGPLAEKLAYRYHHRSDVDVLTLNEDSRSFFASLLRDRQVLGSYENASQRNLAHGLSFFRDKIRALADDETERLERVRRLLGRAQTQLRFVFYQVDNDAEAGLIFEVMNGSAQRTQRIQR